MVTTVQGEWEFPPARPAAPVLSQESKICVSDPKEISAARAEYESDKFARSAVESVKSRLSWWRKRAREHNVEAYPITVERLQLLGALLKRAGYRSAGAHLSVVKNQHIRLGHPWTDALDLEMKEGKRACDRGIGPPQKCGAFDMQKLANLSISDNPLCADGPMWPRGRHFVWLLVGHAGDRVVGCQGVCRSRSWVVQVADGVFSICLCLKRTHKRWERRGHTRVPVHPLLWEVRLYALSRSPRSCITPHYVTNQWGHIPFQG